ncbi:MAG: hypothetical protein ACLFQX_02585 [Candidatus Kapaibacterium sp.]
MRRTIHILFISFILSVALIGCSDDGDDNPTNGNGGDHPFEGTFEFTSDGNDVDFGWGLAGHDADNNQSFAYGAADTTGISNFNVENAMIIYWEGMSEGTFQIDGDKVNIIRWLDESVFYYGVSGELTITHFGDVGGTIEGNFNAKLSNPLDMDTVNITGGNFSVVRVDEFGTLPD